MLELEEQEAFSFRCMGVEVLHSAISELTLPAMPCLEHLSSEWSLDLRISWSVMRSRTEKWSDCGSYSVTSLAIKNSWIWPIVEQCIDRTCQLVWSKRFLGKSLLTLGFFPFFFFFPFRCVSWARFWCVVLGRLMETSLRSRELLGKTGLYVLSELFHISV